MVNVSPLALALAALAGCAHSATVISSPYAPSSYAPSFSYAQFGRTALDSTPYFVHHNAAPIAAPVAAVNPYFYQPYYQRGFSPLFQTAYPSAVFPALPTPAVRAPERKNPVPHNVIASAPFAFPIPVTAAAQEIKVPTPVVGSPAVVEIEKPMMEKEPEPAAATMTEEAMDEAVVATPIEEEVQITVSDPEALKVDPNVNYAIRRIFPVFNSDLRTGSDLIHFVNPQFAAEVSEKNAGDGVTVFGDDEDLGKKIVPTLYSLPAGIAQAQQPTFYY